MTPAPYLTRLPGGKYCRMNFTQPPNEFNRFLQKEARLIQTIVGMGGLPAYCGDKWDRCNLPPWREMPGEARIIRQVSSIALPADSTFQNLIVDFTIPIGYDGALSGLVTDYTEVGFVDYSGDLIWRVRVNQPYVKDYFTIENRLAGSNSNLQDSGFVRVQEQDRIRITVDVGAAASGHLAAGGRVVAGILGWVYPKA